MHGGSMRRGAGKEERGGPRSVPDRLFDRGGYGRAARKHSLHVWMLSNTGVVASLRGQLHQFFRAQPAVRIDGTLLSLGRDQVVKNISLSWFKT